MTDAGAHDHEHPPRLSRRFLEELIFAFDGSRRFTQDSPVLPDVWLYYGCEEPLGALDLLLTPHRGTRAGELARVLRKERLGVYRTENPAQPWDGELRKHPRIAYTHANVAARLYFDELVRVVLPMTSWWHGVLEAQRKEEARRAQAAEAGKPAKPAAGEAQAAEPAVPERPIAALRLRLAKLREAETERRKRAEEKGEKLGVTDGLEVALGKVLDLARERAAGRRGEPPPQGLTPSEVRPELFWMAGVVGVIAWTVRYAAAVAAEDARSGRDRRRLADREAEGCETHLEAGEVLDALDDLLAGAMEYPRPPEPEDAEAGEDAGGDRETRSIEALERVYLVNRNRPAGTAVTDSGPAIKADAARRLFNVDCSRLTWAVIDSGVDATHPAFHLRDAEHRPKKLDDAEGPIRHETRVLKTYDFTRLRELLDPDRLDPKDPDNALPAHVRRALADAEAEGAKAGLKKRAKRLEDNIAALHALLDQGRDLDWALFDELLEMPHDAHYEVPEATFDHGTHVAGILAADWWKPGDDGAWKVAMQGICPDLRLYDLRVLGAQPAAGGGDDDEYVRRGGEEFVVIAALQFVRYLNESRDYIAIHGANLSLSINHDIANYACGRTPVCEECERLVDAGVVVVAAAGNQGYLRYQTHEGFKEGYHTISITDPGNAESVITVGATHRDRPHTYGVSYFSSRGPTGDGRPKPDLVAPGEKVTAPLPGESLGKKDGTSMAAPHVSGAAALLLARYDELVGEPRRVKQLLCSTATDLGRERYFQGAGMLDVLRAMQAH